MRLPALLVFLLCSGFLFGQKKNAAFQLPIKKASSPIVIDGELSESAWFESTTASDFFMVLPMDTSKAQVKTEVKLTYDDDNLYLIAVCYHGLPGPYIVESLRRDFAFGKNDNFLLFMDTFDDQTNGFSFGANAAGAQWDGLMFEGS
ncbi:MAG TPA: carbohydrate binding family 9 domain-containing protein, partial [Cyclobacteriaceae bacterium]|nr:carbohydrate binding family 9 domain-containing protein [Cyclobacteriaceae bacterium]